MTTTATYRVQGMTCDHCVRTVSGALGALAGVREVRVDLAGGIATVTADQPLDDADVRTAVEEAGYELAG